MQELDDKALLREYVERGSEDAFATLVARHVDRVYSVALRHTGNPHHAQEITQAVFVILARKSRQLRPGVILEGWLHQTARLTAVTFIRSEIRRARREEEAYMRTVLNENETDGWPQIAPLLDGALADLKERDRNAVVLRFFYGKSLREVGEALGGSEDTVRMRISRAIEKLRKYFARRGVTFTTAVIAGAVSAHSVQAAPAGLAKTVSAVAVAKGVVVSTSTLTLVKGTMNAMAWLKMKFAAMIGASAVLVAGVATVALVELNSRTNAGAGETAGKTTNPPTLSNTATITNNSTVSVQTVGNAVWNLLRPQRISKRDRLLQKAFLQFPLLGLMTNAAGEPEFQALTLTNPLSIGGEKYYGFRFTVPPRGNQEDLVWAFIQPDTLSTFTGWYILPQTGTMFGFADYHYFPRNIYASTDHLLPPGGRSLVLQSLPGGALNDGQTYLIWFSFDKRNPRRMSLTFTFAGLKKDRSKPIAKVLGLDNQNYLERPLSPPIVNPNNHHVYILLRPATWEDSEAEAVTLGGHLVTVRNQVEENWIFKTFGHYEGLQRNLWIGLSDREKKFHFSWSGGESASYTDWAKGEPNNAGLRGEDYVAIYYPNHDEANKWNDWGDRCTNPIGLPMDGVVEIIPGTTNSIASAASTAPVALTGVPIKPSIVITSHSGSIQLQWPVSASDYMLEATTNLTQPFTMFGYSELTNVNAGIIYVLITNPVPQMYFRLEKP